MSKKKHKPSGKKTQSPKSSPPLSAKRKLWVSLGILIVATVIAMSPLFNAEFVDIDDKKLILNKADLFLNHADRIWTKEFGTPHYKPVTYFTWMLEYRAAGPNPFIFHFNNILLHVLNTILVFFLIRSVASRFDRLKGHEYPIAFFTALFFGVHPMHVESVGWAVERKDVLYTFFYLLGLSAYVRYLNEKNYFFLAGSAVAYVISIFSKSPGITMLPMLFLFDFVWKRKFSAQLFVEKIGHFGAFTFALYGLGILGRKGGEGSVASMMTEKKLARAENIREHTSIYGKAVLAGLRGTLWYVHAWLPFRLSLGYPREQIISFFGPVIHVFPWLLAAAAAFLLRFCKRFPLLFFAHAFFFIALAPAIIRLDLGIGIYMSDRYVYLSILGLLFLLTAWIWTARENNWITPKSKQALLITLAGIFTIMSFMESRVWKNTETLWTNVIKKYPQVDYAWINRASLYREQGQFEKALEDANKGIEQQDNANARVQRGLIHRQMRNPQAALKDYNRALELEKNNTQAFTNRGNALLDLGRFQEAIPDYERVLKEEPYNVKTRVNLAIAYSSLRMYDKAEEQFARAERYDPNYADLFVNRAIMYFESQQFPRAIENYLRYLQLRPQDHQIYNDLGVTYSVTGQYQKAIESFTRAIEISPVKDYYRFRAATYEKMGNMAAAQEDRRRSQ